ncbi:MAG TPA: hypothetical protein VHV55_08205 [Pirellulales bacterium]|jgi:hypothetical protein|nr:hypothetical protein [Pirellulales bacterium]
MGGLLLAQATARHTFEFGRIQTEADWLAPLAVFGAVLLYAVFMYRRDTVELGGLSSAVLVSLRIVALAGLLLIYLQPQWRNERDVVHNSRVAVLVDTSLSMDAEDTDATPGGATRAQKVAATLADSKLLRQLQSVHDVLVYRFDRDQERIATLDRRPAAATTGKTPAANSPAAPDWQKLLAPQGIETRVGQALRHVLNDERGSPLAGIVLITDGQQNAGIEAGTIADRAREAAIPIFPIGVGSDRQPANVRVRDLVVPARAYPGDPFTVSAYLQAQGLAGRTVTVELFSSDGKMAGKGAPPARREETQQVTLGGDGEVTPVRFELTPGEVGRRLLALRVVPPPEDRNRSDNAREAMVEIVDRKTHVLLFAGGPSREYQFLRNQLRRDKDVVVDVLLQTGVAGISQDAHAILDEFPETRQELYDYDVLVAFDPDWRKLSPAQVDLVERWVADQAAGMIVVAGPIYTDAWTQSAPLAKIRALYPVEFNRRFAMATDAQFGAREPWPLDFTRDGLEAPFLWLGDSAADSAADWSEFKGVYGYYAVRGPKPGATVYSRFSDPRAAAGGQPPVYMAGQFFGSGRVFYLGSGEMWRLRGADPVYFQTFYTKLVRYVSQGRLLRGSNRGTLMTERDQYVPGATVEVSATLTNAQLEPLEAAGVPLQVIQPDGNLQTVRLLAEPRRPGSFRGYFTVRKEGTYRLELPVPESKDLRLTALPIQVSIPNLERDRLDRNDALLSDIARRSQGQYYVGLDAAMGLKPGVLSLAERLPDRSRTLTLAAAPDPLWSDSAPWHRARWMLAAVCGVLCLEWLLRRLWRLA